MAGNPNVGKSTLFNAVTGLNQHTGNWPGKTVTSAEGLCRHGGKAYRLVDLPGTYSLLAHSAEEEVARNFLCFSRPEAVCIVCDATCLERNLNLVLRPWRSPRGGHLPEPDGRSQKAETAHRARPDGGAAGGAGDGLYRPAEKHPGAAFLAAGAGNRRRRKQTVLYAAVPGGNRKGAGPGVPGAAKKDCLGLAPGGWRCGCWRATPR